MEVLDERDRNGFLIYIAGPPSLKQGFPVDARWLVTGACLACVEVFVICVSFLSWLFNLGTVPTYIHIAVLFPYHLVRAGRTLWPLWHFVTSRHMSVLPLPALVDPSLCISGRGGHTGN